ncbi:MAG: SPOR domain-containing protein [Campylobacterota bacterium]|nr:SPOR domain-containing protein [Campylobacterota bacterium]
MKDHNLDDLIIDDINTGKSKSKGILTIVALLIVLLITAIVMTRIFLGDSDQNETIVLEEKQEDLISPELQLDPTTQDVEADKKELEQLSSILHEELTDEDDNIDIAEPKPTTPPKEESVKVETVDIFEDRLKVEPPVKEKIILDLPPVDKVAKKPVQQKPVPVAKKETPKESRPKKPKATAKYYIQVGSFTQKPSKEFLARISKNGFKYKLYSGKLLIGPYYSDAAARKDLPKVKDKINKGAFIKHL